MTTGLRTRVPSKVLEIGVASALILWRIVTYSALPLWRDWLLLLGFYWIYTALRAGSRDWPCVTVALMAFLLTVYSWNQVPLALQALDLKP